MILIDIPKKYTEEELSFLVPNLCKHTIMCNEMTGWKNRELLTYRKQINDNEYRFYCRSRNGTEIDSIEKALNCPFEELPLCIDKKYPASNEIISWRFKIKK